MQILGLADSNKTIFHKRFNQRDAYEVSQTLADAGKLCLIHRLCARFRFLASPIISTTIQCTGQRIEDCKHKYFDLHDLIAFATILTEISHFTTMVWSSQQLDNQHQVKNLISRDAVLLSTSAMLIVIPSKKIMHISATV